MNHDKPRSPTGTRKTLWPPAGTTEAKWMPALIAAVFLGIAANNYWFFEPYVAPFGRDIRDQIKSIAFHPLTLRSFNYSRRQIRAVQVNGIDGPTGPLPEGMEDVCCLYWPWFWQPKAVKVRWAYETCQYSIYSRLFDVVNNEAKWLYKEEDVPVPPTKSFRPTALNVHIYPDDHVEVDVTEGNTSPRIKPSEAPPTPTRPCTREELADELPQTETTKPVSND